MRLELKNKIKRDKHYQARGGTARLLQLSCAQCLAFVCEYQKDGPGGLLRIYLDRIIKPQELSNLQQQFNKPSLPVLRCSQCQEILGLPMHFGPSQRLAYRLLRGKVLKKKL